MDLRTNTIPIVLVKNEELWIEAVLTPLLTVFGKAVVGDTGSDDDTLAILRRLPGVELIEFGLLTRSELGQARVALSLRGLELGGRLAFQVDGDELYNVTTLRWLLQQRVPAERVAGFTTMVSLDMDEAGQVYELDDLFSRLALWPAGCRHYGEYPFEAPEVFSEPQTFHYFPLPPGYRFHALHLHRFPRSRNDKHVILRQQKQFQYSMQDAQRPRVRLFDLAQWRAQ